MKKLIGCLVLLAIAAPAMARDVWVNGYTRADGTYVPGHYRSAPDSNPYNNYTSEPNVNPYNGNRGTVKPYEYKPYTPPRYTPPTYTPPPAYKPYVAPCYFNCGDDD
jgi:hypothetical protein